LGSDRAPVDVIRQNMTFYGLALFLTNQRVKDPSGGGGFA